MAVRLKQIKSEEWITVENNFEINPFISHNWLKSFENRTLKTKYFKFTFENKTIAICSGLEVSPPGLLNKFYKILSFFSGISFKHEYQHLLNDCISELIKFGKENNYTRIDFGHYDSPMFQEIKQTDITYKQKKEYYVDLSGDKNKIYKKIRESPRRITRNATKKGLEFIENNSMEAAATLIDLLESTKVIRKNKNFKDYSYFYLPFFSKKVICNMLRNHSGRIFQAKKEDEVLCSIFFSTYKKKGSVFFIGSSEAGYKMGAPTFIWVNLLLQLQSEGVEYLNIGGVPADSSSSGLAFFKESIGGQAFTCWGGSTIFLQGNFSKLLNNIYQRLANMKKLRFFRQILKNKFT